MAVAPLPSPSRRPGRIRRVVVVAPSAFTLGNLFFGFWAIVTAYRGNLALAGWFVVLAGVLDTLDGRLARLAHTGSRFGAELDSLADVISFGMAPGLIMYFLEFQTGGRFAWVLCFVFVVATALRLARYNVIAAGATPPTPGWFTGLPCPAAGMTLAVYYPFSQTEWYQRSQALVDFQHQGLVILMILLSVLMVSTVKYPRWPRIGLRSVRGVLGLALHLIILAGALLEPAAFLFPLGLTYLTFGVLRFVVLSLLDRSELAAVGGARPPVRRSSEEDHP